MHNNYKDYDEQNVKRIQLIKDMKKFGLSLKECAEALHAMESCNFDAYQTEFIQSKITEIEQKIEELQELRKIFLRFANRPCKFQHDPQGPLGSEQKHSHT